MTVLKAGDLFSRCHEVAICRMHKSAVSQTVESFVCMVRHLHHVPGRLRLCLTMLKRNEAAVAPLREELLSLQGVDSVSVNPITGSVIIRYDRNCFDPEITWTTLQRLGFLQKAPAEAIDPDVKANDGAHSRVRNLERMVADAAVKALVDAALELFLGRAAGAVIRHLV